jgi:hypothetical protein
MESNRKRGQGPSWTTMATKEKEEVKKFEAVFRCRKKSSSCPTEASVLPALHRQIRNS